MIEINPPVVSAIADVALAVGTIGAAIWAAYTFRKSKELEAARWQKQIFDSLFLSGKFDAIREALDRDFDRGLARKIELSVQGRDDQIIDADRKLLTELDNFLNLLEYMLYLEQDQKQIDENDRNALFGYWITLFRSPPYATVRHYASNFDYERVAALTGAAKGIFLLLYGSLRRDEPDFTKLKLAKALKFESECVFAGDLYDLGEFPGAVPGEGKVKAELYQVTDPAIFSVLDDYEEFDASNPDKSLYVRRCVHVPGFGEAWVYMYNGNVKDRMKIASGDWLKR